MDANCHVYLREGYWHWEVKLSDGTKCAMSTVPYATAEEAEHAMEGVAAALTAACLTFFERRAA